MTYVLQAFATAFMLGALLLMTFSIKSGNYPLAAINLVLFVANAGLFYWQGAIRGSF